MADDLVTMYVLMIQELVKSVKPLQSNMVELKSRGNRANVPPTQSKHLVLPLYCVSVARYVAKVPLASDRGTRMMPT